MVSGCVRSELLFGQNVIQVDHPFHALKKRGAGWKLPVILVPESVLLVIVTLDLLFVGSENHAMVFGWEGL